MFKNLLLIMFVVTLGLSACADPFPLKKRDNKTDNSTNRPPDNGSGGNPSDNGSGGNSPDDDQGVIEDFFLNESQPPMIGDMVDVTKNMLRPFDPDDFNSRHNYTIDTANNKLIVDGNKEFVDNSLSRTDDCSKAFYDSLTGAVFEHNNKIYLTNRKHINEFNRIFTTTSGYESSSVFKTYVLVKDIDLCNSANGVPAFIPIGRPVLNGGTGHFWATFDGDNHIVENLFLNYTVDAYNCAGFMCGLKGATSAGKLFNIGVSGKINITGDWGSNNYRGAGLIGFSIGGDVKNVVSNINITGRHDVGGIVGTVFTSEDGGSGVKPATIVNVKNYGRIIGINTVGGVVGSARNGNTINNRKAKNIYKGIVNWGTVTSSNSSVIIGGLFGSYDNHDFTAPVSCKNGGKPTSLFGKTTISFTCE